MGKNIYLVILLLLIFLGINIGYAAKPIATHAISNKIDKVLHDFGENLNIGILVEDLDTGKILYSKNADRYFAPASNQKLFTAWAALNTLPLDYTFQTSLYADVDKIQNGILNSDIYFKFSGDPTFTFEQLDRLVYALAAKGVKKINGKIIIDDTAFDNKPMSPGTTWDDKDYCYGAPTSALVINQNCVIGMLQPGASLGSLATLTLPNQPQFMYYINKAITGAANDAECKIHVELTAPDTFTITGCIKQDESPQPVAMAIQNPRSNMELMLKTSLDKHHTSFSIIEYGNVSTSAKLLTTENSPTLEALLAKMLKDSDNGIADSLFKSMGALYAKQPGSWDNGSEALHKIILETLNLDINKHLLIDGAGASRYIFHTPEQIVKLLHTAYYSPFGKVFYASMPISAIDGTLKERMKDANLQGKIMAKTGTMTGVSSLSGYMQTPGGKHVVFSIMMNNFVGLPENYKKLEDELCHAIMLSLTV